MDKLRDWRKAKGIKIEEAGALVGVSGVQWHRYENGSRRVSVDKLPAMSRVTGIPAHELRPDLATILAPASRPSKLERTA